MTNWYVITGGPSSGKTTTVRMMTTLTRPTAGTGRVAVVPSGGDDVTPAVDRAAEEPVVTVDEAAKAAEDEALADEAVRTDAAEGDADPFVDSPYGEGSYVGANPPEGFVIKGNERSMKFHVQGNGGYDRTIADVWFNSEEAAEAAGFTKAQR